MKIIRYHLDAGDGDFTHIDDDGKGNRLELFQYGYGGNELASETKLSPIARIGIVVGTLVAIAILFMLFVGVSKPRTESGYQYRMNL